MGRADDAVNSFYSQQRQAAAKNRISKHLYKEAEAKAYNKSMKDSATKGLAIMEADDLAKVVADRAGRKAIDNYMGNLNMMDDMKGLLKASPEFASNPKLFRKATSALGEADSVFHDRASDFEALSALGGVHKSVLDGLRKNDPTAMGIAYMLREAKDWPAARYKVLDKVRGGRTLDEFKLMSLNDLDVWNGLEKASKSLKAGEVLGVTGSFATDIPTFMHRHMLMDLARNGHLDLDGLAKAYGRGGDATVFGRILPDLGKRGGPFSQQADFDFFVYSVEGAASLPGSEARLVTSSIADSAWSDEVLKGFGLGENGVKGVMPERVRFLEADFDYAKFENGSMRGFGSSFRGSALFENGRFAGRNQSLIYGQGGAMVRDFGFLFDGIPQKLQSQISHPINISNTIRLGSYAFVKIAEPAIFYNDLAQRGVTTNQFFNDRAEHSGTWFPQMFVVSVPPPVETSPRRTPGSSLTGSSDEPGGPGLRDPAGTIHAGLEVPPTGPRQDPHPVSEGLALAWEAISDEALAAWMEILGESLNLDLELAVADLDGQVLGFAEIIGFGPDGRPSSARVTIDRDAAERGWFVDQTPLVGSEFGVSRGDLAVGSTADSPAYGRYDLYTFALHEIGHLLGLTAQFSGFAAASERGIDGAVRFNAGGVEAILSTDGEHLDTRMYPNALMNGFLRPGVRELPSMLEGAMLHAAWNLALAQAEAGQGGPSFANGGGALGFVELARSVQDSVPSAPVGLVNGSFSSGTDGWRIFGDVRWRAGGDVTLAEDPDRLFTDLSQTFVVPVGAGSIRFTLVHALLQDAGGTMGDAFEVALLDAFTGDSLLGAALSQSDALLNLQPDGRLFMAPAVSIVGRDDFASGDVLDTSAPVVFEISLDGVAAGTMAGMFFDLAGFGDDHSSEVTIDEVGIVEGEAPRVIDGLVINGGDAQRSMVRDLAIRFDQDVSASLTPDDFLFENLSTGAFIDSAAVAVSYDLATNTATFTFPGLPGGSLPDGHYAAYLSTAGITNLSGLPLVLEGETTVGSSIVFRFHRYLGDRDGDTDVDFLDVYRFESTYLHWTEDVEFDNAFDFDSDGDVDNLDLFHFQDNFHSVLPVVDAPVLEDPFPGGRDPAPAMAAGDRGDSAAPKLAVLATPELDGGIERIVNDDGTELKTLQKEALGAGGVLGARGADQTGDPGAPVEFWKFRTRRGGHGIDLFSEAWGTGPAATGFWSPFGIRGPTGRSVGAESLRFLDEDGIETDWWLDGKTPKDPSESASRIPRGVLSPERRG
jgi:hypothetical protein